MCVKEYRCILIKNKYRQENFLSYGESVQEIMTQLQCLDFDGGLWFVSLNDQLLATCPA